MTLRKHARRGAALGVFALLLVTAVVLLAACGAGDKPAMNATTLYPSPSASNAGTGGSGSSGGSTKKITDKSIRGNILVRLSQDPSLVGFQFKVAVHHSVVTLSGRVKTKKQKRSAEQIAVSEPGVKRVLSYIEVTGGGGY